MTDVAEGADHAAAPVAAAAGASSASSPMRWSLPVVLLILLLVAYPFLFAIWVSFTDQVIGSVGKFIGFNNFSYLPRPPIFYAAIWNTITIVLVSDVLKLGIGLGLALLVHQALPGRGIFRSFLMLPWAMPAFVAFLTWRVLYQPIGGGINLILDADRHLRRQSSTGSGQRSTAMPAVIAASVWRGFPFWFVSILAALQSVPKELYEAAQDRRRQRLAALLVRHLPGHPAGGHRHHPALARSGPPTASSMSGC